MSQWYAMIKTNFAFFVVVCFLYVMFLLCYVMFWFDLLCFVLFLFLFLFFFLYHLFFQDWPPSRRKYLCDDVLTAHPCIQLRTSRYYDSIHDRTRTHYILVLVLIKKNGSIRSVGKTYKNQTKELQRVLTRNIAVWRCTAKIELRKWNNNNIIIIMIVTEITKSGLGLEHYKHILIFFFFFLVPLV